MLYQKGNSKGFTLVEVLSVLVIIAIIAAIAIPNILGYKLNAEQQARVQTARSIFNVTQNALNNQYERGLKGNFIDGDGTVDLDKITPPFENDIKNRENIRFLRISRDNTDPFDTKLYRLISNRVADKTILKEVVLVEYNNKTGNVLSAFFSDDPDVSKIGYGDGGFNASIRDEKSLKDAKIGYWDVDSTGEVVEEEIPEEIDDSPAGIQIVDYGAKYNANYDVGNNINQNTKAVGENYGLLTVEVKLPLNYQWPERGFVVKLKAEEYLVNSDRTLGTITRSVFDSLPGKNDIANVIKKTDKYNAYKERIKGRDIIVFIIDTPVDDPSLVEPTKYINSDFKVAQYNPTMQAYVTGMTESTQTSKFAKAYFSGGSGITKSIEVSNSRHMKHINKVLKGDGGKRYFVNIKQTKNIVLRNYDDRLIIRNESPGKSIILQGQYDGQGYTLYDVTINGSQGYVGTFDKIKANGSVTDLSIDYTDKYWDEYNKSTSKSKYFISGNSTGGIAGLNQGRIENCQVMGKVNGTTIAGGIAAKSDSSSLVAKCYNGADVFASGNIAGGIVGHNYGGILRCESGTFTKRNVSMDRPVLVATPYFGLKNNIGKYAENKLEQLAEVKNNSVIIETGGAGGHTGGIVGKNTETSYGNAWEGKDNYAIKYCVNASLVRAKGADGVAGGIVGTHGGSTRVSYVKNSYNAGDVIANKFAGGIIGYQGNRGYISVLYNTGETSTGTGGIVGYFQNSNGEVYAAYTLKGLPIGETPSTTPNIRNVSYLKNQNDGISGTEIITETNLRTKQFEEMAIGTKGLFAYPYPHIDIRDLTFHRTPWK
ncbi:MAG: prepilin-type N-terminal cleavage/methylation domain-containing protein [Anaerovoracaceae bacterium]